MSSGKLQGEAALTHLKQQGQYDSLQAAMRQARYTVQRANSTPLGRPAWHAPNPAAGYDGYVTEEGVSIALKDKSYVSLTLRGIGYGYPLQYVGGGEVSGNNQSLTIKRDGQWSGLKEWYVNGESGLEQGFTLSEPPGGSGKRSSQKLRLALEVNEGWRAIADEDGKRVTLLSMAEGEAVEYTKLVVWDAHGSPVAARLLVEDERVIIEVDDANATYPLMIDPIFTQQAKLTAPDAAINDSFGDSVALDGNTAAVGAPLNDVSGADQGSVYVFVRSGTVWTFQANLTAVDGVAGDQFGFGFSLSGDTLVIGAPFDDHGANTNQGSVYVFTRSGTVWTQQQKLTANDGATGDHFGIVVALSGSTLIAGAADDDNGANADQGSAYVFTRSGLVWTQQQQLTASDGLGGDRFGRGVALDGETAIVGAPFDDSPIGIGPVDQGSAYVFTRNGTLWTQQQRLASSDGTAGDLFGYSVALSGDTAIAGAYLDDVGAQGDQGSAYVFTRSGTTWTQQQKLTASDGAANDHFGFPVVVSGDTVVVGAAQDDSGTNLDQGAAYVFARNGGTWAQQNKLFAADSKAGDNLGSGVALSGDTVIVGALLADGAFSNQGAAYVFTLCAPPYTQQQKLTVNDGAFGDHFGYAVALNGDTLVVGAYGDGIGQNVGQGSTYVFIRNGTTWTLQQKLTASDGAANDFFGTSVALNGDTVVAGVPLHDTDGNDAQGATYVFTRSGTVWMQQQKLIASDGRMVDLFGTSVAVSGDTLVVGARGADISATNQGSAYVFTRSGTTWTQQQKLIASDAGNNDFFGASVALSGDTVVVGASDADIISANDNRGSAYVFVRSGTVWTQQDELTASDGAANDFFGTSVALSGDSALVGNERGSAYVFTRSPTVWPQQQKLSTGVNSVTEVALSGDTAALGVSANNNDQGAVYAFTRAGVVWTPLAPLTASDGSASDRFGSSVALNGDTLLIGAEFDGIGMQNTQQGSVYVYACPSCPTISLNPVILPNGVIGTSYNQTLTASGGTEPYQFSLSSGALPAGVTLAQSGLLFGTPTTTGTYTFTVTATILGNLCSGNRTYIMNIATCTVSALSPTSANVSGAGGSDTFTITAPGCTWLVLAQAPWLSVTSNSTGTGNLVVTYNVAANPGPTRTGLLTVNNQTLTVNQSVGDPNGDVDGDGIPNGVEYTEGTNPELKDNDIFANTALGRRLFVMQQYRDFLGREGDAGGITNWVNALNANVLTRAQVIESFFNSAEFQNTGAPIVRLYFACFLRIPDYAGLQNWITAYRGGMPLETIANFFVTSPEFLQTYGALDNTAFVTLVYNNVLGRAPDPTGLANWVNALNNGMPRGTLMVNFSESQEYKNRIGNSVYVTMMYVGMLRRSPDQTGFDNWVAFLNQGNSGLALINGFIGAQEYRNRFLP